MTEALDCGDVKTDQGITTGMALHKLVPVARTRARKAALENAKFAALGKALLYRCKNNECPRLKLTIWLGEPFVGVDPRFPCRSRLSAGSGCCGRPIAIGRFASAVVLKLSLEVNSR